MAGKIKYIISFRGLSVGKHEYEYHLNDSFFEDLPFSEVTKGDVRIDVRLNKQSTMLILDFIVRGKVTLPCDRCGDDCTLTITGQYTLYVKPNGVSDTTDEEDIVVLAANDGELDIAHHLYEYTILSLPAKRVHAAEKDCNQEVIQKLKEIETNDAPGDSSNDEPSSDPRWDLLKNLKFNN